MGLGDPKKYVYQLIFDQDQSNYIQYFNIHGLGLCIKLKGFVAHMLYPCSFIHNKSVTISIKHNKYFLSLNTYTTVFSWGGGNSNKNRT